MKQSKTTYAKSVDPDQTPPQNGSEFDGIWRATKDLL